MDKQKIISIIAISIIISTVSFTFLNIYALEKLNLSGIDDKFRFFSMSNNDKIRICNNFPIPINFNQIKIIIFYENNVLGTFLVNGATIMPYSVLETNGKYVSDSYVQSQYLFMHFDHLFSGGDSTIRIDPRNMNVITEFQTTVIGIPYAITKQQSSLDFWNMLNDENNLEC